MENLQEKIAKRAYELFIARGGQHGYHIADWLQAEKEMTKASSSKVAAAPAKAAPEAKKTTTAPAAVKATSAPAAKKKVAAKK